MRDRLFAVILLSGLASAAASAKSDGSLKPYALPLTNQEGAYTRYELLAPGSKKFRILYDVTETKVGATAFFNPIRKGSISTEEKVTDLATGKPLEFHVVSGAEAKATGMPDADPDTDYIRVALAHPVPADGGQARLR